MLKIGIKSYKDLTNKTKGYLTKNKQLFLKISVNGVIVSGATLAIYGLYYLTLPSEVAKLGKDLILTQSILKTRKTQVE